MMNAHWIHPALGRPPSGRQTTGQGTWCNLQEGGVSLSVPPISPRLSRRHQETDHAQDDRDRKPFEIKIQTDHRAGTCDDT